jgi:hypothetical protein
VFQQLVDRMVNPPAGAPPALSREQAAAQLLGADPLDLLLYAEQVWNGFNPWFPNPRPAAGPARRAAWSVGEFFRYTPLPGPIWDHLGASYVLENTRAVQILRRVVREYRSGEGLGIPTTETQRWLNATETLLFGAHNPLAAWPGTSTIRPEPEAVRRNAYWRMFGLDLAFGTEDNKPPTYDKANAANGAFLKLFEELLFELWQAISNARNTSGVNQSDDDRIYRLAEQLAFLLRSRRQFQMLAREELAAATVMSWVHLTLSADTPVVIDLKATATSPANRLRLIGERVGLAPHSKSDALISMASDLSLFLRTIESGIVNSPALSWVFYLETPPGGIGPRPIGVESRRLITEWSAATGKDLKVRSRPAQMAAPQRQLVGAR